jgi:hypothetical protein
MKQRITTRQLQELTEEQRERLREWFKGHQGYYDIGIYYINGRQVCQSVGEKTYNDTLISIKTEDMLPLLSIGQMIEILHEKDPMYDFGYDFDFCEFEPEDEICDRLWEGVKGVLQRKEYFK